MCEDEFEPFSLSQEPGIAGASVDDLCTADYIVIEGKCSIKCKQYIIVDIEMLT